MIYEKRKSILLLNIIFIHPQSTTLTYHEIAHNGKQKNLH